MAFIKLLSQNYYLFGLIINKESNNSVDFYSLVFQKDTYGFTSIGTLD